MWRAASGASPLVSIDQERTSVTMIRSEEKDSNSQDLHLDGRLLKRRIGLGFVKRSRKVAATEKTDLSQPGLIALNERKT
jgi:hypothetical protein